MKRLISLALMCLMLLTLRLAACADGSFSVAYGGCIPGNAYALFIVNGEQVVPERPENILFMDQRTAITNTVNFLFVAPNFTGGTALLSGEFQGGVSSPLKLEKGPLMRMPGMLTEIGESAFEGDDFTHVYIGDGVTSIGSLAFADCGELLYIYIPDSVTSIADDAFSGSPNVVIGCRGGAVSSYAEAHGIPCEIVS